MPAIARLAGAPLPRLHEAPRVIVTVWPDPTPVAVQPAPKLEMLGVIAGLAVIVKLEGLEGKVTVIVRVA